VLEPQARNSAAAIAAAAVLVGEEQPGAVLWIMAADAAVQDVPALLRALDIAASAARAGRIATFGIRPTAPETGYGYIEAGGPLAGVDGAREIARFVEKPDAATAAGFLAGGRHLWNSGMFVATAATLLAELRAHAPEVLAAARGGVAQGTRDLGFVRLGADFAEAPSVSIDTAVMERTGLAAVVPCEPGWSDVGSWSSLWEIAAKDADGNATTGPTALLGARRCYVRSEGILTAVVGLEDVVLVVTDDAVLACHRDRAQDVKKMVEQLKAAKHREATEHRRVYRPWGAYEGVALGTRFQVKRITVRPGSKLSLQKHYHRAEHWGRRRRHRPGRARRRTHPAARERKRLPAARLRPPPGKPRHDPTHPHRSAVRILPRRRRHRPTGRYLRTSVNRTTPTSRRPGGARSGPSPAAPAVPVQPSHPRARAPVPRAAHRDWSRR
jgi:mannose-1-phosphate guanylyltransferase/mannose-6-phosphate isomerase